MPELPGSISLKVDASVTPAPTALERTGSTPREIADYGKKFPNCKETEPGSGEFVLSCCKKLMYAWPGLGYYAMRYLRSTYMKKFYADVVGMPMWWIAFAVALGVCASMPLPRAPFAD